MNEGPVDVYIVDYSVSKTNILCKVVRNWISEAWISEDLLLQ